MDMRSPFVISIAALPRQEGAARTFESTFDAPAGMGIELLRVPEGDPIAVSLNMQSVSEGVLLQGAVRAWARGECARCVRDIEQQLEEAIAELVYYPQSVAALAAEDDEEAQEGELPLIHDEHIDLEPLIRDAIVLGLPLQPLCQPDCRGLCPECGERWDDLPEDHQHEYFDPRFSALDALAEQLAGEASGSGVAGAVIPTEGKRNA